MRAAGAIVASGDTGPIYRIKPLAPERIASGQWYFGVTCEGCRAIVPVLDNPAAQTQSLRFRGAGSFGITSPCCGTDATYPLNAIRGFRMP
jgi:hypothetical protein